MIPPTICRKGMAFLFSDTQIVKERFAMGKTQRHLEISAIKGLYVVKKSIWDPLRINRNTWIHDMKLIWYIYIYICTAIRVSYLLQNRFEKTFFAVKFTLWLGQSCHVSCLPLAFSELMYCWVWACLVWFWMIINHQNHAERRISNSNAAQNSPRDARKSPKIWDKFNGCPHQRLRGGS